MILRYSRSDGSKTPAESESVEVSADGRISGWRSVSELAVGSFAGQLPSDEVGSLQTVIEKAADSPVPTAAPAPGSAHETVEIEDQQAIAAAGFDEGPWADLLEFARELLNRMCDFPYAAIGVVSVDEESAGVEPADRRFRLEHRGESGLTLDLSGLELKVAVWQGYYENVDERTTINVGPSAVVAGPGWSLALDLPPDVPSEIAGTDDLTVHLSASFRIISGAGSAVKVSYAPIISPKD